MDQSEYAQANGFYMASWKGTFFSTVRHRRKSSFTQINDTTFAMAVQIFTP